MENENQITVDVNDKNHERVGADPATVHESDDKSENVADTNDRSDVIDVIGNGQLVKKVKFHRHHHHHHHPLNAFNRIRLGFI